MTPDPGQWHRLHPLSPLVRSGRAAVGVLAIVGISASGQFGRDGSHLYDWAVAVLVVIAAVVSWLVTRWKLDGSTLRIETGAHTGMVLGFSVSPDGKLAYMHGTNATTVPGPKGALITIAGRGITIWRQESDGQWRCVIDIWNDPPAAGAPSPT